MNDHQCFKEERAAATSGLGPHPYPPASTFTSTPDLMVVETSTSPPAAAYSRHGSSTTDRMTTRFSARFDLLDSRFDALNTRVDHHFARVDARQSIDTRFFEHRVSVDYLTKPIDVFKEMSRILKPGGLAIIR
ncbi:hypothetical protein DH2020_018656 [Rehmannia glutinosa]|uniref:Methyltransferase type 11 domain-containing protein n=1 Tax=Rehmannia glutinosa TaxID=99300 RepID=A0ABR0WKX2_REHGL